MKNFDYAWFKDMDAAGNLFNNSRLAGDKVGVYSGPAGETEPQWDPQGEPILTIPNEEVVDQYNEIWLLVDYIDRAAAAFTPNIQILDDEGKTYLPDDTQWSADFGQVLLHWTLDDQPAWEQIIFPDATYKNLYDISTGLGGNVKDWNLATYCVPEPGVIMLLSFSALALLRRRREH